MKTWILLLILFIVNYPAFADRELSSGEINTLLNDLAGQPVQTWLPAGSISARRLEYSKLDKSICEYRETLHFDGTRFYREISLISGEEEIPDDQSEPQNSMDMDRERIFCWDGTQYIQYYKSTDTAVIESRSSYTPSGSYGVDHIP